MAENMIKFLRGSVANLPQNATAGAVYFTKDEGLYLGLEDGTYHRYGDFIEVANVDSLPAEGAHIKAMYYCTAENILAKWNGIKWVQINKQQTLAELGGVAKSVYEAKVAALEKADTDNAAAIANLTTYVGTIPTDADVTNVVAYVDKKTAGIATDAALTKLTDRVTTAEGDIDKLEASLAEGGATANAIAAAQAAGDNAQADVDALELKVGAVAEGKTVVGLIETAQAQADKGVADAAAALAAAEAAQGEVDALETVVANYKTANDAAVQAAQAAAEQAQKEVDAVEELIGDVAEGKTVVEMIADAQATATYDDTALKARVKAIEDDYLVEADKTELNNLITAEAERADAAEKVNAAAIKAIADDYLKKADKEALQGGIDTNAEAIAAIKEDVDAFFKDADMAENAKDTLKELQEYIASDETGAAAMAASIKQNADDIDALEGRMDTAEVEIDTLQAVSHTHSFVESELNKIADGDVAKWNAAEQNAKDYADDLDEAMDARVKVLEEIDHNAYVEADKTVLANAKAYADGLDSAMDERMDVVEGKAHEHANKALLDTYTQTEANLADAVAKKHEHANAAELAKISDGDVAKWNGAQAAAEATAAAALATAKSELEGKITAEANRAAAAEAQALTDAKAYTDGKDSAMNARVAVLEAIDHDAYKGYADKAEEDAIATAKAYTESLMQWGSF